MRHIKSVVFFALLAAIVALPERAFAQDDYAAWQKKESERLRAFLSKEDAQFADFLKKDWTEFSLSVADKPLVRPKPRATPVAPVPAPAPVPEVPPGDKGDNTAEDPAPAPAPVALPGGAVPSASALPGSRRPMGTPRPSVELAGSGGGLSTLFYGGMVPIPNVQLKLEPLPATITKEVVSSFWEQINAQPYKDVLTALQQQRSRMALGDWAFAQLIYQTGLTLAKGDTTMARLISWHFLVKSGYATRVGFSESKVFILVKSNELLYGTSYFTTDKGKYYALDLAGGLSPKVGAIYTYEQDYPGSTNQVSFAMAALPFFAEDLQPRTLRFAYKGQKYAIDVEVNRNLVRFLTYYPQTELASYLNAEVPSSAMDALVDGLKPMIAGRPEVEQVELILRFVQTAFEYKTDGDQFNREKWFFPEETLFYPYSDCEDRSILFAYLVRKLVPVSVVGLIYSDHIATAVKFNSTVNGDSRMHNGVRYVVSDPTYINASVGMEMEQYKSASPRIVDAKPLERR